MLSSHQMQKVNFGILPYLQEFGCRFICAYLRCSCEKCQYRSTWLQMFQLHIHHGNVSTSLCEYLLTNNQTHNPTHKQMDRCQNITCFFCFLSQIIPTLEIFNILLWVSFILILLYDRLVVVMLVKSCLLLINTTAAPKADGDPKNK